MMRSSVINILGQAQVEGAQTSNEFDAEQTDRRLLTQIYLKEQDPLLRDLILAQLRFRHEILPLLRSHPSFLDLFFQKPPTESWSSWYMTCCARVFQPVDIPPVTVHYLQRWIRQVYDPRGPVRVVAVPETGGLGLWNFGPCVRVKAGERLFDCVLDGIVVPTRAIAPERVCQLFSVYQISSGERRGIYPLVGPISLLNGNDKSPWIFRTVTAKDEQFAFQADLRKEPDDRFWYSEPMFGLVKCVVVVGNLEHGEVSVQGSDEQIFGSYS